MAIFKDVKSGLMLRVECDEAIECYRQNPNRYVEQENQPVFAPEKPKRTRKTKSE